MIDMFSVLKDWAVPLTTIIAGSVGSYVALAGLSTWKRQLKGQTDHDLARRLLVILYRYREAIRGVRHPAMFIHEHPEPPEIQRARMNQDQIRHYGERQAYQNRWNKVQDHRLELDADLLEAEALWGGELRNEIFPGLFSLEWELFTAVRHNLEMRDPDGSQDVKEAIRKISNRREEMEVLYDSLNKEDDFSQKIAAAIAKIENYLKPKLGRA
jgi:hypothetical protein